MKRIAAGRGAARGDDAPPRLPRRLRRRPRQRDRPRRDPRRQGADGRRSARRRRRALLGAHRRALRHRPHGRQRGGRPDLPLHDRSTGTARSAWTRRRRTRCSACSPSRTASTSPSPATPTTTGTASSPPAGGLLAPNEYLAVAIDYLFRAPAAVGGARGRRQDGRQHPADRSRRAAPRPAALRSAGRLQVVRRRPASTARSASAAKRAPAPRSCAATARSGRPTRTASSRRCSPARSRRAPAAIRAAPTTSSPTALGRPFTDRVEAPANAEQKKRLAALSPDAARRAASSPASRSSSVLAKAPGNGAAIGGIKVIAASGWFAARPSGTEDIYKIYAESFASAEHLQRHPEGSAGGRRPGDRGAVTRRGH